MPEYPPATWRYTLLFGVARSGFPQVDSRVCALAGVQGRPAKAYKGIEELRGKGGVDATGATIEQLAGPALRPAVLVKSGAGFGHVMTKNMVWL